MRGLITFVEQFFWTMIWIFAILIVGWFIINYARNNWSGNAVGTFAGWVSNHVEPQ